MPLQQRPPPSLRKNNSLHYPQALDGGEIRILQRFYDQLCALVEAQRMSDPLCLMVVSKVGWAVRALRRGSTPTG